MKVENDSYEGFLRNRDALSAALGRLAQAYRDAGVPSRADAVMAMSARLNNDAFRLMVVGEFKRGKSTLINALLGEAVLPAAVRPCTAVITEVKFAPEKRAVLHHMDPARAAQTIRVEDINKYVVIADSDEDDDAYGKPTPYRSMEVYWPLDLCKSNVQVIDSPGLNEHQSRTDVALDYLPQADAILMVLSCEQQFSQSEREFLDERMGAGPLVNAFFVWNRYDAIADSPEEIESIQRLTRRTIEPRLGVPPSKRVFYVSGKDALAGRIRNDPRRLEDSKIRTFEKALEGFLASERGRVKMLAPLESGDQAVREFLTKIAPGQEAQLKAPLAELEARYVAVAPRLDEVRKRRQRLIHGLERHRERIKDGVTAKLTLFEATIARNVESVVAEMDVSWLDATVSRKKTIDKLQVRLQAWFKEEATAFQEAELAPMLARETEGMKETIEEDLKGFLGDLDSIRSDLVPDVTLHAQGDDLSATNRVLSAVGGFLIGGIGGAAEGAAGGWQSLLSGAPIYLGAAVLLVVMSATLPVSLAVMVAISGVRIALGGRSTAEKLRETVAKEFRREMAAQGPALRGGVTARIDTQFAGLIDNLGTAMSTMISGVEQEFNAVVQAKRAGEAEVSARLLQLERARIATGAVGDQLADLRRALGV